MTSKDLPASTFSRGLSASHFSMSDLTIESIPSVLAGHITYFFCTKTTSNVACQHPVQEKISIDRHILNRKHF